MDVRTVNLILALLAMLALAGVLMLTLAAVAARISRSGGAWRDRVWDRTAEVALPLAGVIAIVAMAGSLYESEVAHFVPCRLCWYQRIVMYPLAVILPIAAVRRDRRVRTYVLPLALIGAALAAYHYQLEWFPQQGSPACTVDAPCTTVWVRELGFVSIPFMALCGFAAIAWLTWIAGQRAGWEPLHGNDEAA